LCRLGIVDFNLLSNWRVSLPQKSEFAVLVLDFEKLGLGLENCGRTTKNAYCHIYSLCSQHSEADEHFQRTWTWRLATLRTHEWARWTRKRKTGHAKRRSHGSKHARVVERFLNKPTLNRGTDQTRVDEESRKCHSRRIGLLKWLNDSMSENDAQSFVYFIHTDSSLAQKRSREIIDEEK
jgi:hypothetical protein